MSEQNYPVTLVCWHCGKAQDIFTTGPAQFGFELAGWASQVGMVGFSDFRYGRVLIFCNSEHARAELTKSGTFRLRPKGPSYSKVADSNSNAPEKVASEQALMAEWTGGEHEAKM